MATSILRLDPPVELYTPKGAALAYFLVDRGYDYALEWVTFVRETAECWTFQNQDIRLGENVTDHRPKVTMGAGR